MSIREKRAALATIANGAEVVPAGTAKFRVGRNVVHVRFCSESSSAPDRFKFNINPNTLTADYELWVCGGATTYYFIPIAFIRRIYENPSTYEDRRHPGIKVVSVDAKTHTVTFATGGVTASLRPYYGARL